MASQNSLVKMLRRARIERSKRNCHFILPKILNLDLVELPSPDLALNLFGGTAAFKATKQTENSGVIYVVISQAQTNFYNFIELLN